MAYADFDDVRMWYEDSDGDGLVLVLMHAIAGNSDNWAVQAPALRDAGYRVVTYDQRGLGRTRTTPGRESDSSQAGDLEALVQRLGLPPFFLVATAYGGFGAVEFAIDNPSRLRGLVVSTSFGGVVDPEFTELRSRYVPADLGRLPLVERELGKTYRAADPEGVRRFLAIEASNPEPRGRQSTRQPTTYERLARVSTPTLVIAAGEDVYAPPPVMQAIAEHIPGARFEVIEGAGHSAYWERPEAWRALVLGFVDGLRRP